MTKCMRCQGTGAVANPYNNGARGVCAMCRGTGAVTPQTDKARAAAAARKARKAAEYQAAHLARLASFKADGKTLEDWHREGTCNCRNWQQCTSSMQAEWASV